MENPSPFPPFREQRPCQSTSKHNNRNFGNRGLRRFLFLVVHEDQICVIWGWVSTHVMMPNDP